MTRNILGNLQYAPGSRKPRKRIGRGQGSGHGGTSTRGHKGAGSRSGTKYRPWFEGGQMPLSRRVPKYGFESPFRVEYQGVNVVTLEKLVADGKVRDGIITPEVLCKNGLLVKKDSLVKILGNGELKSKLEISANAFSKSAIEKIEAAGGKVNTLTQSHKSETSKKK